MAEPTFDHERLDVYRLSIDSVEHRRGQWKAKSQGQASEDRIEYECRDAEYEYELNHQSLTPKS